jgi:type II secretory pathway pseudopilin PulG
MRAQQGFAILELMVAAILTTLLAVWAGNTLVNKINDAGAQASAVWMLAVKQSALGYMQRYAGVLTQTDPAAVLSGQGYADWAAPQLTELKADGLLSPGLPEFISPGGGASIRLIRSGACPGASCRLEAIVYSNTPFLSAGKQQVDEQMVAQWMMAAQGWGGSVTRAQPHLVRGSAFEMPNPPVPGNVLPAGTVALAITSEQLGQLDFLRVGDARDPDFRGTATVAGNISTHSDLHVQQYLHLGAQASLQEPCEVDAAVARETNGGLLVCRGNIWRPAGRTGSGGYSVNLLYGCQTKSGSSTENPITGTCACPAQSVSVLISDSGPQVFPEGRTMGYLCID